MSFCSEGVEVRGAGFVGRQEVGEEGEVVLGLLNVGGGDGYGCELGVDGGEVGKEVGVGQVVVLVGGGWIVKFNCF